MAKKRAKVDSDLFSSSDDLFGRTEPKPQPEQKKSLRNITPPERLKARATYDIGPELKEVIKQESVRLGIPASMLAKYLLLYAWDFYQHGEIPPPTLLPSNSPAYRNIIDFSG